MEKWFDLQLFADDTASVTGENATGEPAPAEQKPDTQPQTEKKYSDADVDKILNKKFAAWQEKKQKEVDEAKKLAEMNATQKAEYERDQLKKELAELKRKDSLAEMAKTARKMLNENGVSVGDELLSMLVSEDAEQTKAVVDGFTKSFKEALEKAVTERLKGDAPRKGSGGVQTMTKAQIMAIQDPKLRQQKMLEHRELFNF